MQNPPHTATFFLTRSHWLAYCAASTSQNRCAAKVATRVNNASSHAAQRVFQPTISRIAPPSSIAIATQISTSGIGKPSLPK
jgi:hypothetical protein